MNTDVLHKLAVLSEEIIVVAFPIAEEVAKQDPKAAMILAAANAFLLAARDLKQAISAPPQAPPSNGPNT